MNHEHEWMCKQARDCLAASDRFKRGMNIRSLMFERHHVVALRSLNTLIEQLPFSPADVRGAMAQCQIHLKDNNLLHIMKEFSILKDSASVWGNVNLGFGMLSYYLKVIGANTHGHSDQIIQRVENMDILDQILGTVRDLTAERLKGLKPRPLSAANVHHCRSISDQMRVILQDIKFALDLNDTVLPHTRRYVTELKRSVIPSVARAIAAARQDGWPGRCSISGNSALPLGDVDRALAQLTSGAAVDLVEEGASYLLDASHLLDTYIRHSVDRVLSINDDLSLLIFVVELKTVSANWKQIGEYADELAAAFRA